MAQHHSHLDEEFEIVGGFWQPGEQGERWTAGESDIGCDCAPGNLIWLEARPGCHVNTCS